MIEFIQNLASGNLRKRTNFTYFKHLKSKMQVKITEDKNGTYAVRSPMYDFFHKKSPFWSSFTCITSDSRIVVSIFILQLIMTTPHSYEKTLLINNNKIVKVMHTFTIPLYLELTCSTSFFFRVYQFCSPCKIFLAFSVQFFWPWSLNWS